MRTGEDQSTSAPSRRRRFVRGVGALVLALGFVGAVLAAGVWIAGRGDQEPAPAAADEDIIREDPEALVCDEARGNPQLAAPDAWPLTFAGLWIDEKERMLYVAFTERAEEKIAKLAECFPKRTFTPVTFEHSERELVELLDRMSADRNRIKEGTLSVPGIPTTFAMGIYTKYNVIHVGVEEATPETIAAFTSRYGDHVVVQGGLYVGPGTHPEPLEDLEELDCTAARGSIAKVVMDSWPVTFSGLWIDDGRVHAAFTEGAEEKVAQLRRCYPERTIVPITFERTLWELEGLTRRMGFDRELIRAGRLSLPGVEDELYNIWVDETTNTIRVLIDEVTPETIDTFRRRYGEHVIVEQGDLGGPEG